jgi:molybdenum cofactor biosynthesis protein B
MGHQEHHEKAPRTVTLAVLSVSTTRALAEDAAGHWIADQGRAAGHSVVDHRIVPDGIDTVRGVLLSILAEQSPQAVIVTGGTGVAPLDVTIEAIKPLFGKELSAFGPLFAQLSYQQIGPAALISRATAGTIDHAVVFCLPGSLKACQLACEKLIFPELGHLCLHATGN